MHVIEDDFHAEPQDGEFATFEDAVSELERRSKIPWDEEPNRCPCTSWRTCHRDYVVIEYDTDALPWTELSRKYVLKISSAGVEWLDD